MNSTINHLLQQVSLINKKYEDIANITGENFNVFRVLGLTTNEVRTHSAFIAELLNPKGTHGQKSIFLKLFCEQLKIKGFDCDQAICKSEQFIGYISEDPPEGGYIDIGIADCNRKAIFIENKIHAIDQKNQLLRYYNFGKKNHPEQFKLYYLSLDGKDAHPDSKTGLTETEFTRISYQKDILEWLEACKEKAVNLPILRETMTQYIYLIKYLTHQTINNKMKEEIVKSMLANKDSVEASFEVASNINEMKRKLIIKYAQKFQSIFNSQNLSGFEMKYDEKDFPSGEFTFSRNDYSDYVSLCFYDFMPAQVGVSNEDRKQRNKGFYQDKLKSLILGTELEGWGPQWVYLQKISDLLFDSPEYWSSMADNIFQRIDEMVDIVNKMTEAVVEANNVQS